jgi:hypothetical protein
MTNADLAVVNTLSAPLAAAPKKGSDVEVNGGELTTRLTPIPIRLYVFLSDYTSPGLN